MASLPGGEVTGNRGLRVIAGKKLKNKLRLDRFRTFLQSFLNKSTVFR